MRQSRIFLLLTSVRARRFEPPTSCTSCKALAVLRRYLAQTTKDIAQAHRMGSQQNEIRMPQAKSSEKYRAPPKKLTTNPLPTIVVQNAHPDADIRVYFQLWGFMLRFFILILLWFVGMYLHLLVFVLHDFFLLSLLTTGLDA